MNNLARILFIVAIVLAIGASALILTSTSELREYIIDEELGSYEVVHQVSWYESQGWWGVAVVLIFAALYYAPYRFYSQGRAGVAAIFGVAILVLTYLAGFSIGQTFLPAAGAMLLALIVVGIERLRAP